MKAGRLLADWLYPRFCAACGRTAGEGGRNLCWDCRTELPVIAHPYCARCGNPVEGRIDHAYVCYHCLDLQPHFDVARSAARYEGALKEMVHAFKYGQALWYEYDLADLLLACVRTHYSEAAFDVVTCVPLHPLRRRARGYNQSDLLARRLAAGLRLPARSGLLARVRATETQTHLTARERADNVKQAFEVRKPRLTKDRRILLVDDVMTTGATVSECAHALKKGGAAAVHVVTICRGG